MERTERLRPALFLDTARAPVQTTTLMRRLRRSARGLVGVTFATGVVLCVMLSGCGAKTGLGVTADDGERAASRGPGSGATPGDGSGVDGPSGLDLDTVPECPFADGAIPEARGAYPFCQWTGADGETPLHSTKPVRMLDLCE